MKSLKKVAQMAVGVVSIPVQIVLAIPLLWHFRDKGK